MRVGYTTSSIALALLEVVPYQPATKALPPRYLYTVELDESQITWLAPDTLPENWNAYPHRKSTQHLGDGWARRGEPVALAVPSVLATHEVNVMLNCLHPDFAHLKVLAAEMFPINSRLIPDASP